MPRSPINQPSGASSLAVGNIMVSTVNDGVFGTAFDHIVGADIGLCEQVHRAAFRPTPPWLTINTFLVRLADALVLVDAGYAAASPTVGRMPLNLAAIGVEREAIDAVLMTHLHPDHEAGLTNADGRAAFPNAELIVHADELRYWLDEASLARAPASAKADFAAARSAVAAYKGRVRPIASGEEVLAGVSAVPTPGHTPGHTAWLFESAGDSLLIWGDIIHLPGIQFAIPEASVIYDLDSAAAAAARKHLFDRVAADRTRVAGIHLDFPAFGRVIRAGDAYAYIPEVWTPTI